MTYHYRCHSIVKLNFVKLIQVARKSSLIYQLYFELTFVLDFKKTSMVHTPLYHHITTYHYVKTMVCHKHRESRDWAKAHHVVHTK